MAILTDHFVPVAAWVREQLGRPLPEPALLRAEILSRIEQARSLTREAGVEERLFEAGLFPVVAWIDESLMSANWAGALEWSRGLLQKSLFRTGNGGVEFFRRLSALGSGPEDREVLAVYYMILQLGFQGQYGALGEESSSLPVRRQLQAILEPVSSSSEGKALFPEALPGETALPGSSPEGQSRKRRIRTLLLWGAPPAFLLILFLVFDRIVHQMAGDVMGHLH